MIESTILRARGFVVSAACTFAIVACACNGSSDNQLPLRSSAPLWLLSNTADVRIGGAKDSVDDEFDARSALLTAIPWPDGGLVVLDGSRLRRFSVDGRELWRSGARGRGPWEFESLVSVCRTRADTLIAFDAGTRRLSVFAPDGTPVRMTEAAALGIVPLHACLGTGAVLAVSPSSATAAGGFNATVRTVNTAGVPQDSVGTLPFMSQGRLAVLVAHDDWLWSAAPWKNELFRLRTDGTVIARYTFAEPERMLSGQEAADSRTIEGAMGSGGADPAAADIAPWFDEAVPGHDGALWLRTFDTRNADDAEWVGISPNGSLLGRFTLPRAREVVLVAVTGRGGWLMRRDTPDGPAVFEFRRLARSG